MLWGSMGKCLLSPPLSAAFSSMLEETALGSCIGKACMMMGIQMGNRTAA